MSTLTQGLDNLSLRNRGENGQYQEGWSSRSFEEGITKLFYQLVRVDKKTGGISLAALNKLYTDLVSHAVVSSNESQINFLIALLFQTRDISGGKGEYALFYNLLPVWESHFNVPMVNKKLAPMLVLLVDSSLAKDKYGVEHVHSYGSWKDFKYILETYKNVQGASVGKAVDTISKSVIPAYLITLVKEKMNKPDSSLIARWLPREKSKFGWQAKVLAPLLTPRASKESSLRAYRKTLATLNKQLGTVQINQCANTWAKIDFDKDCTSITMSKQKKAFMCQGSNKDAESDPDRKQCSENYLAYLEACKKGDKKIKAARTSPGSMVKEFWTTSGFGYAYPPDSLSQGTKDTYNLMWKQQQEDSGSVLANCVPILDTSGSMTWENCPLYDATAVALKIAENSTIGKRVMTFSETPTWINLEGKDTLEEMVSGVVKMSHSVGMSTNMQAAFQLLCDACVHKDMTPEEVEDIVLVVLSDMQADQGSRSVGMNTLEEIVQKMFHEAGLKTSHKRPYAAPTMVWWNMRTTNGSPCSVSSKNTVMMSGYDASVLSTVMEGGIEVLKELTAWDNLKKLLSKERYSWAWRY